MSKVIDKFTRHRYNNSTLSLFKMSKAKTPANAPATATTEEEDPAASYVVTPEDEETFSRAKVQLLFQQPFYAMLLLRFPMVMTDKVPVAAADRAGQVLINMKGLMHMAGQGGADRNTKSRRIMFVLAHEIMHVAFAHVPFAMMKRLDMKLYNYATDFVINQLLDDGQVGDRPDGLCYDPELVKKFNYDSYAIYNHLKEQAEKKGASGGPVFFNGKEMKSLDELLGDGEISQAEYEEIEEKMKQEVSMASMTARMQGKGPAFLDKLIDEFLDAKVNWRETLQKYVCQVIDSSTRSYSRLSRKGQAIGFMLPATEQEMSLREIVIAVDTSGSVYDKLQDFGNEINAIKNTYNLKARVIYCDDGIGNEEVFEADEDLKLNTVGGGGTSLAPPAYRCNELLANGEIDENSILVYFTDTYGDFPSHCDIPIVWAVVGNPNPQVPFGDVCLIND